jgi:hypothetical protein
MKLKSILLTVAASISLATATMAQVPNYVPTNGLVGWWPFNGNSNDESGNGNNGTVNGATLTIDRFGQANKAYDFNGSNNKITIPNSNSLQLDNGATFSLWARIDTMNFDGGSGDFDARLIDKSTPGGVDGYLIDFNHRTTSPNPAYFNLCSQGSSRLRTIIGVSPILTDCFNPYSSWSHLIITFNNGVLKSYINGFLSDSSLTSSSTIQQNINNLVFGYATSGISNTWLNGQLDDIGIWNRALTQQEITDLYNGNICYQTITVTDTLLINMGITSFNPVTYNNTIKIFPNPTNDHITIDYGNFTTLNGYQLKIINSLSQQVFQTNITQQSNYLNLTTWGGNGLYFVQIIDPQGNIIDIRKILLQ